MTTTAKRAAVPPRTDVLRSTPFAVRAAGEGEPGDGLTLDGFAAVFNRIAVIDSWEGKFKEQILPGSMKRSFREAPPVIQFDHGRHPLIGSLPVAELTRIAEESDPELAPEGGAHVLGRIMDNWLMQPVRDAIAEKSVNGMSFRFEVVREEWRVVDRWWTEEPVDRHYFEVVLEGGRNVCVYRDAEASCWFTQNA